MVREGAGGLMDEAPPPEMVARIKELIGQHAAGAIEAHDTRTRHAGLSLNSILSFPATFA
jgi:divalent metal cation (Fe/Co/Zn/Cd) transporter